MKCSIVAATFRTGAALISGLRNKKDQYNYGAGGAAVGLYTSVNGIKARKLHTVVTKVKVIIYSMTGELANGRNML